MGPCAGNDDRSGPEQHRVSHSVVAFTAAALSVCLPVEPAWARLLSGKRWYLWQFEVEF